MNGSYDIESLSTVSTRFFDHRFDALYSKLGNGDSDAGHMKCSHRPQVSHLWFKLTLGS